MKSGYQPGYGGHTATSAEKHSRFDFDGDGKPDMTYFIRQTSTCYIQQKTGRLPVASILVKQGDRLRLTMTATVKANIAVYRNLDVVSNKSRDGYGNSIWSNW